MIILVVMSTSVFGSQGSSQTPKMQGFMLNAWDYTLILVGLTFLCYTADATRRKILWFTFGLGPDESSFTCFLSHDWGTDERSRSNHSRVGRVAQELQAHGLRPWFDADQMEGDINAAMTDGIDRSTVVVIFVTSNYLRKVAGQGPRGFGDNCEPRACAACTLPMPIRKP